MQKTLEFKTTRGNHVDGELDYHVDSFIGNILFRSPKVISKDEMYNGESEFETKQLIGFVSSGQVFLALGTIQEFGKRGTGTTAWNESWQIVPIEDSLAECLKALAPQK